MLNLDHSLLHTYIACFQKKTYTVNLKNVHLRFYQYMRHRFQFSMNKNQLNYEHILALLLLLGSTECDTRVLTEFTSRYPNITEYLVTRSIQIRVSEYLITSVPTSKGWCNTSEVRCLLPDDNKAFITTTIITITIHEWIGQNKDTFPTPLLRNLPHSKKS